jgi:hypothetical protein
MPAEETCDDFRIDSAAPSRVQELIDLSQAVGDEKDVGRCWCGAGLVVPREPQKPGGAVVAEEAEQAEVWRLAAEG